MDGIWNKFKLQWNGMHARLARIRSTRRFAFNEKKKKWKKICTQNVRVLQSSIAVRIIIENYVPKNKTIILHFIFYQNKRERTIITLIAIVRRALTVWCRNRRQWDYPISIWCPSRRTLDRCHVAFSFRRCVYFSFAAVVRRRHRPTGLSFVLL